MHLTKIITRIMRKITAELSWFNLMLTFVGYLGVVWVLLWLTNEHALIEPSVFLYYTMVVISTVGFGDFSPTTHGGRLVVALVQIPFGLLIFGAAIGKITQFVTTLVRKGMNGKKDFSNYQNHILIFGWREQRTKRIIDLILADKKRYNRNIILCVEKDITHPFPDIVEVEFAKLDSFSNVDELKRIAISEASSIIVDGENDDMTLSMVLGAASMASKEAHISAYFYDETKADLLRAHCPNVESASSRQAEILVRSMQSPGASYVHEQLFSTLTASTLYSMTLRDLPDMTVGDVFQPLREKYGMTIMGVAENSMGKNFQLNPAMDYPLLNGQILHYLAKERVRSAEVDWANLSS